MLFADFLNGTYHLELSHLINSINVVDTFLFILVALMNRANPNKARLAILARGFFLSPMGAVLGRVFFKGIALLRFSEVIQMRNGYAR